MSRSKMVYTLMLDVEVVDGSFNELSDVMQYIQYRLNLRGRDTDSIG